MSDTEAIRRVLRDIAAGYAAGDAARVMGNQTPDAAIFSLAPPLQNDVSVTDLQAWIDGFDAPPTITHRNVTVEVSGDLAAAWGFVQTRATMNGEAVSFWARHSWAFKREGGNWKVAHVHESVPFVMDGSEKAALDLQPGSGPAEASA